jgi:thymidylate synthase
MNYKREDGTPFSKEEFLHKLKTDKEFSDKFGSKGIDQIQNLINLLKTNPDDRGIIVSAWNVGELDQMVLRPCHNFFQFYTREIPWYNDLTTIKNAYVKWSLYKFKDVPYAGDAKADTIAAADKIFTIGWQERPDPFTGKPLIELECFSSIPKRAISLMWNQRSVDTPLGLPFNIASYALLLEIVGKMVNMVPDELIGTLGDTHIYLNQIDGVKEQLTKEPYELPTLKMGKSDAFYTSLSDDLSLLDQLDPSDFTIENYQSHPAIKVPLSN